MLYFQRFDYGLMQRRIVICLHEIYIIAVSEQVNMLLSLILVQRHGKYTFWKLYNSYLMM